MAISSLPHPERKLCLENLYKLASNLIFWKILMHWSLRFSEEEKILERVKVASSRRYRDATYSCLSIRRRISASPVKINISCIVVKWTPSAGLQFTLKF